MRFDPWECPECDAPAKGTLDTIPGIACLRFDEDGSAEYSGETLVDWDGQATRRDAASRVTLMCPAGHPWQADLRD